uniref:Uncharacterized protein n=1 Tax=Arundo donax TaxID=35708 RepID=A0A0A8ZTZ3_ARUDO
MRFLGILTLENVLFDLILVMAYEMVVLV